MDVLAECIFEELGVGTKGKLEGISLPSFLQLMEIEEKTCALNISSHGKSGRLFFTKGELFAAKCEDLKNEEAVYELLSWEKVEIRIDNDNRKRDKEIIQPLMAMMMEGLKRKDDKSAE